MSPNTQNTNGGIDRGPSTRGGKGVCAFTRLSGGRRVVIPNNRILSIAISRINGATMVRTTEGDVIVAETFDEAVGIFSEHGGVPCIFYTYVNEDPIAIPLASIERIELSEWVDDDGENGPKTVVITHIGRMCVSDSLDEAVSEVNEKGGRICTFHKKRDGGTETNVPAKKVISIYASTDKEGEVAVLCVGKPIGNKKVSRILLTESLEEAAEILSRNSED